MGVLGHRRAFFRVLATSLLLSATLSAEANESPFVVRLAAAPECPDGAWLEAEVTDQLGEQRAPGGTLNVDVTREWDGFVALASFALATRRSGVPEETNPRHWQRQLADPNCEVLLRAVSLGVVLWWEGEGLTLAPAPSSDNARAAAGPTATSSASAPTTASTSEPPTPTPAVANVPPPTDTSRERPTERSGSNGPFRFLIGLGAGVHTGLNPNTDVFGEIHVGLSSDGNDWPAGRYVLHLSSVATDATQGRVGALGGAPSWTSRWWSLGVRACPWSQRMGSLVVGGCGAAQLIRDSAGLAGDASSNSTWVTTLGPGLQAGWEFGALSLQLFGGLDIPLVPARPQFQRGPVFRQRSGLQALASADFAF